MSVKVARKIGFIASLAMLLGSVVGIGIFLKSNSIYELNGTNGVGTLISWSLAGLLSLATAISFSEISFLKSHRISGLSAWSRAIVGKRFGYFVRFNYAFFYFGILLTVFGFLCSQMLFNLISFFTTIPLLDFSIILHVIVGFVFTILFVLLNYFSLFASGIIQIITTVIKWLPLVAFAIIGIMFSTTNFATGNEVTQNAFYNGSSFNFENMVAAIPLALFAFDAFLNIGVFRNKMKSNANKVPLIMILGIALVMVLYFAVILSSLIHGVGYLTNLSFGSGVESASLVTQTLAPSSAVLAKQLLLVFITISVFGITNSISAAAIITFKQGVRTNTFFGSKTTRKWWGEGGSALLMIFGTLLIWTLAYGIPAIILKSDAIVDGILLIPTITFFSLYGIIIGRYALKRNELNNHKINTFVFYAAAVISVMGSFALISYQFIYHYIVETILSPAGNSGWGLLIGNTTTNVEFNTLWPTSKLVSNGVYMSNTQASIVVGSILAVFVLMPCLDLRLSKWIEKVNPLDVGIDSNYIDKTFVNKTYGNPVLER